MRIRLPIPEKVLRAVDVAVDWLNVSLAGRLRRIDLLIGAAFLFCVAYYWSVGGWTAAITGALLFVFIVMYALWF